MKIIFIVLITLLNVNCAFAQMIAKMEIKEPIKGLCNDKEVYTLFPYMDKNQVQAESPVSKVEILKKLNEIEFLKTNPKYKGKGMLKIIINCWGEIVFCKMDAKTKNTELDEQIVKVYDNLGTWKNATLNEIAVDNVQLISFTIKQGVFFFE